MSADSGVVTGSQGLLDQGEETGSVILKFKLDAEIKTKKGVWKRKPALYNAKLVSVQPEYVGAGSTLRVKFEPRPYAMDSTKTFGISKQIISVQIIELKAGGGDTEGFDEEEGYEAEDNFETQDTEGFESDNADEGDSGNATDF